MKGRGRCGEKEFEERRNEEWDEDEEVVKEKLQ